MSDVESAGRALLGLIIIGVAIVIALGISYTNQNQNQQQLAAQGAQFAAINSTTPISAIAANIATLGNGIVLNFFGNTTWISASNPLTITISGAFPTNVATNVIAANSPGGSTISYSFPVTSNSPGTVFCTSCGNFLTMNQVTVTGVPLSTDLSFNVQAVEVFNAVSPGSAPASYSVNTITANDAFSAVTRGLYLNYTQNAGGVANTSGTNGNYVYYILFMALVLSVIIGVLAKKAMNK